MKFASDDGRLELDVPLVGWYDGTSPRNLGAHELDVHALACRAECHLRRDDVLLRARHLRLVRVALHPAGTQLRQSLLHVDVLRSRRIVQIDVLGAILDADAAEGNLEVLSTGCDDILIDFLAVGVALAEQGRLAERVRVLSEQVVEHLFGCGNADLTVRELLLREPFADLSYQRVRALFNMPRQKILHRNAI